MTNQNQEIQVRAQDAVDHSTGTIEAVIDVATGVGETDLTPHEVVKVAKAIGEINHETVPSKVLHDAVKAAVTTIRTRNTNPAVAAKLRRTQQMRSSAAAHIRKIQALRLIEQAEA